MKSFYSILALFCIFSSLQAQSTYKINGTVTDKSSERLGFATVALYGPDSTFLRGTVTNDEGQFSVSAQGGASGYILIKNVGFSDQKISIPTQINNTIELGTVALSHSTTRLSEVTISGNIGVTEIAPTKVVYATRDLVSQRGGTAGDILKNMPSVTMGGAPGHNRDVRFRGLGNGYTKVLINGRSTGITGNNRETVLDQIPANAIERIEILSNPTAEYTSDGLNGIINIVLKQSADFGPHGSAGLFFDSENGYSGTFSGSMKAEKWDLYGNYDRLIRNLDKTKDVAKTNLKNGAVDTYQREDELEERVFTNDNVKVGARFRPSPKTSIGAEFLYGKQIEDKDKTKNTHSLKADSTFKDAQKQVEKEYKDNYYTEYYTEVKHSFDNRSMISVSGQYTNSVQDKDKSSTTTKLNAAGEPTAANPALQREDEVMKDNNYFVRADYLLPVRSSLFKAGYSFNKLGRSIQKDVEKFDYNTSSWIPTSTAPNDFDIVEKTQSFYASYEVNVSRKIKGVFGTRAENTHLQSVGQDQSVTVNSNYWKVLPNVNFIVNFDSTQYMTLSFSERLRRPGFQDLNPFEDTSDPAKVKLGNPSLTPESAWAYEIGYLKNFKRFNAGVNVFYRDISNLIQKQLTEVTNEEGNNIQYEQPVNLSSAYLAGVEFMVGAQPFKWWQLNISYSHFDSEIQDEAFDGDAIKDQVKWVGKVISDFSFPYDIRFQAIANYLGPKPGAQESEEKVFFTDMGIQKGIGKRGQLSLRLTDVFNSLDKHKHSVTDKSVSDEWERSPTQVWNIGFIYKL
jgi:outer membrane receptor for ferrienterochelin and colicin